jgi:hypothetical protein
MLLIVWAPWNPQAHQVEVALGDAAELNAWTLLHPRALEWAQGVNLPAVAVVTPAEFAIRRTGDLPSYKIRFYGVWLVGLLCWYMVGRFVDDLLQWRSTGTLPRKRAADLTFALVATPSAVLLATAFHDANSSPSILAVWSVVWLAITGAMLLFRVTQEIRQRRRRPVH